MTSELQEVVSLTRMQPVGTVLSKFPRLVRDLARDLGKEAQLETEGSAVELDKTILEGLSDPLSNAKLYVRSIRNADGKELFYFEIPFEKYLASKSTQMN